VELVQSHQVPWEELRCVRFWDLAATDPEPGKKPDWSVGALIGYHDITHDWYLLDIVRMQGSPGKVTQAMKRTAIRDGFEVPLRVEQEVGGAGKWAVSAIEEHFLEYDFHGRRPTGNKEVRFNPVSVRMEPEEGALHGRFKVLMAPWNEVCFNELELFPNTEHDDQADAISGAYMELARGNGGVVLHTYIEGYSEVGDLRLVGDHYIDKE
jgi:predicted phage terminase large subunit-like protein